MDRSIRVSILAGVLGVVAAAALWLEYRPVTDVRERAPADEAYRAFAAAAKSAEAIADPLQRCLRYPDPPGTHWHADTTEAYCELKSRQTIHMSLVRDLIAKGNAAEVDRIFQHYQDIQVHDTKHPGMLDWAMYEIGFDDANARTRATIDEWKRLSPESGFALAASGAQYLAEASGKRGAGYADDLTRAQIQDMHEALLLARTELAKAEAVRPDIMDIYSTMLSVGSYEGDGAYIGRAARSGLKTDPSDFRFRMSLLQVVRPQWGGDRATELRLANEASVQASRFPLLRLLASGPGTNDLVWQRPSDTAARSLPAIDQGATASDMQKLGETLDNLGANRLAIELYSEVLRFSPRDASPLHWRATLLIREGDVEWALTSVRRAEQLWPGDGAIAMAAGQAYVLAGRVNEAEAAFQRVIAQQPDRQDAIAQLADMYAHAGHQPDKAMALAGTLIEHHPENPDGYVVRACVQMDNLLPGRYETVRYFLDHWGNDPRQANQASHMRAWLARHPEPSAAG